MSGSDRPERHASAEAPTPARFLLLEALQAVATNCRALEHIARGPRGSGGNLADFTRSDDWALSNLRDFWEAHDNAQRLLDGLPFPPDALAQLDALARQKAGWKLATRATLDAIADAISETRPTFTADAAPELLEAERRNMLTAWRTAGGSGLGGPPRDWLALLHKLKRLTAALNAIRSERYPAAGADRRGGAVDDLQAQRATANGDHGQAGGAEDPTVTPQDLAGGDGDKEQDAGKASYPTPDNYERDKWICEQRNAGKTISEIRKALADKPEWYPLDSDNGIRDAVKRYAEHVGIVPKKGRSGKPRRRQ